MKHIPNFLTICNLLSGCIGIVMVSNGQLEIAAYLIWLAAIFDFFDGFSARALKSYSRIGGELDSLADMVTFGVLPSYIVYALLSVNLPTDLHWLAYGAFLIAAFSALRLAIFNVDTRQTSSFIGLPTPANALLISSLPLSQVNILDELLGNPYILLGLVVLLSYLLVAEIELMAFKFKNYSWADNQLKYIFMIVSLLLVLLLNTFAIPLVIILYILLSLAKKSMSGRGAKS
ncbi:MAG: CDP-diacylglycerol--serine O-phosphatidyltransferase [Cyclobacteriaceae bacterium]